MTPPEPFGNYFGKSGKPLFLRKLQTAVRKVGEVKAANRCEEGRGGASGKPLRATVQYGRVHRIEQKVGACAVWLGAALAAAGALAATSGG
jgi:hypothetical protein